MESKDLLSFVFQMGDRIWLLWGLHTTVAVAVVGWLIAQRNRTFERPLKIVSTVGYTLFFIAICVTFVKGYRDLHLILTDLRNLTPILKLCKIHEGYIGYLLKIKYPKSIKVPLIVCSGFYVFILYLIWSNWLWLSSNKKVSSDKTNTNYE